MDFNAFLPPHEPVELPSRGKLYSKYPAVQDGWIHIRQYAAPEEALLAQINRENVQQVLNSIIDNCLQKDQIKAEDLTTEDAFYLLVWLRTNSYGPSYDIEVTCTHRDCGMGPDTYTINLAYLTVNYLEGDVKEPLNITLPTTKLQVEINCMRRKTEMLAQKRQADVKKWQNYPGDPAELLKRAYSIVKIISPDGSDETTDILEIEKFCLRFLPSKDSLYLDNQLEYYKHGVDINTTVQCHYCQRDIPVIVPPGPEFFRPTRYDESDDRGSVSGDDGSQQIRETGRNVHQDANPMVAEATHGEIEGTPGEGTGGTGETGESA